MIKIEPENPTSDDNVEITVYLYCPSYEATKSIVDSQFTLTAIVDKPVPPCVSGPPIPYPWSVGRLHAGEYQVFFTQVDGWQETLSFSVSQGESPFPTPSIPSIGIPAALLLAVALVWIANKALKFAPSGPDA